MKTQKLRKIVCAIIIAGAAACGKAPGSKVSAAPATTFGGIVRLDSGLDALVSPTAAVEKVSGGYKFLEGPLWRPTGVLWFSDLVGNAVHQWSPDGKVADILNPGGYDGKDAPAGGYIGPNGMVAGPDNTVILCQHGNRRIVRMTADGKVTTLIDRYGGKRLNSPNDLVYGPDGAIYFTDPPFGLPQADADPAKELKFNGVFRYAKGKLEPVIKQIALPNGIGFSPDYKTLYLSNSEPNHRNWFRCEVTVAGAVEGCRVFADATSSPDSGVPDGLKLDSAGNVYAAGPGGIWVFSPAGGHLGTIRIPETPSNCTWGDDGKTLYITAVTSVYRIRLNVAGEKALYN